MAVVSDSNSNNSSTTTNNNTSSSNSSKSETSTSSSDNGKTWHEAVYKTVNHPAETKKVNHPSETKQVKVVDKKAYTYEESVYEYKCREICNDCGADLTDMSDKEVKLHIGNHLRNGDKGSWRSVYMNVQVGTRTVTVPEEYHYEMVVVKEA